MLKAQRIMTVLVTGTREQIDALLAIKALNVVAVSAGSAYVVMPSAETKAAALLHLDNVLAIYGLDLESE